jgi:uncharacterized membrane protein
MGVLSPPQALESRTALGKSLSAPLLTMAGGIVFAAIGVIPADCHLYGVVWEYMMPLAAALFILESDVTE